MDRIGDDGRMDCTEPPSDELEPEIVCERPKGSERGQGSTDEERPPFGVSDHTTVRSQEENDRYKRNLKKFLEIDKVSLETGSSEEKNVTERLIKSDGTIQKTVEYRGNASKISSILAEVRLKRSSAPPTYETASKENPENKEIEFSKTELVGNSETPVSSSAERVPEPNASDNDATPSRDFKAPVAPPAGTTPKSPFVSPGSSKTLEGGSTPILRRPTSFFPRPRKSFYTFSPEGSSILRQCQSMPNINRRQRKEEKRRSLVLEPENRSVVRWLFVDRPGQTTPETGLSRIPHSYIPRPSREDVVDRGSSSLGNNTRANICRKLTFAPPDDNTGAVAMEAEEDGKRKEISPPFAENPPAFVKKVRISPKLEEREDVGMASSIGEQESNDPGENSDDPEERSPVKKKSDEFSSSKKM